MAGSEEKARPTLPLRLNNSTMLNSGCGMSPVTDLMFNLSGLSTNSSLVETPKRRISWTSLTPSSVLSSIDSDQSFNESPQPDTPVSQNRLLKDVKSQNESTQIIRRVRTFPFHPNPLRDKENIPSYVLTEHVSRKLKCLNNSTNDSNSSLEIHDSGYSTCQTDSEESKSIFEKNVLLQRLSYESETKLDSEIKDTLNGTSTSNSQRTVIRSSLYLNDDGDDFLDVFGLDKQNDNLDDFSVNITNLLTKPVIHSLSEETSFSDDDSNKQKSTEEKKTRPGIRRCLSLMSECDFKTAKSGFDSLFQCKKHSSSCDNINNPQNSQINKSTDNNNNRDYIINEMKPAFKRPDPPKDVFCPIQSKRRKSVPLVPLLTSDTKLLSSKKSPFQRCHSETEATIMKALQRSVQEPDLIGDFSKPFALPLVKGKHQDVKTIAPDTVIDLLKGKYKNVDSFTVVDCRYPYEFEGGHIVNAKNIYTKEGIIEYFLSNKNKFNHEKKRNVIIFHCEFSSERGPTLYRFLRNMDRELNKDRYPMLHHPELYVLHGGYKAFYESFKEYCEPQEYKPMLHKEHEQELRQFKAKSKSWNGDCKARMGIRPGLKF